MGTKPRPLGNNALHLNQDADRELAAAACKAERALKEPGLPIMGKLNLLDIRALIETARRLLANQRELRE